MQLRYALTTLLYALCAAEGVAGRGAQLRRRQEETTDVANTEPPPESTPADTATATSEPPPETTAEPSPTSEPATTEEPLSTTEEPASTTSEAPSSTTEDATPTAIDGAAKATETAKKREQLPIQPVITPAIGIAGVILMGTGVAFCLIGIKHQWLHVYLSAAYSTALGVTVLIVYVMTPPVSDAIQGAYFVAAVMTGLIFGGLSLVFKEVTEGLGCLIGGFCLAMWFMVLRPGGLVQSDSGRAIMIGVFSVVGLSLSFSQYTRNYGLIGCTAFAGAMITVLGIDCFSRAGLKEFWLYVWSLNDDIFPIGTHTYPITRGIRVEIAVTVIIFLFGVMSQLKIWKIVKERREKKAAQQLAEDESRDQLAGEVGQDVEALNKRQRAEWEAMYGNGSKAKLQQDSGVGTSVGSTHKKSASVTTREIDTIEMDENPRSIKRSGSKQPRASSANIDNDWQSGLAGSADWSSHAGSRRSGNSFNFSEAEEVMPTQQPGGPQVVPLPFSPPVEQDSPAPAKSDAGSAKSGGTAVTALNPLALKQHNERTASRLPRIEDDRASSIAATADDEPDVDGDDITRKAIVRPAYRMKSTPAIEVDESASQHNEPVPEDEKSRDRSRTPSGRRTPQEPAVEDEDDEELVRPQTAAAAEETDAAPRTSGSVKKQNRDSSISSRRRSTGSRKSAANEDDAADEVSAVGSLTGHLPEAISKVAMAYRTNEWAKHIADADQPDDIEQEPDSPGVQVDTAFRGEAARPVDTQALSEVPVVTPTEGPRKPSKRESKNPYRQSSSRSVQRSSSGGTPTYAFQRSNSQQSLMRQSSGQQLRRETTNPSSPAEGPLIESPIEENMEQERFVTPATSSNNLLDQRNDRLKRKTTTTNFNALNLGVPEQPAAPASTSSGGEEEMTLAQRRTLIQQQQNQNPISPTSPPPRRISNPPAAAPLTRTHSTSNPNLIYDSHQPQRSGTHNTQKQSAMYSAWRTSLQRTPSASPFTGADSSGQAEQARQSMLAQRDAEARERTKRQERRARRESKMDVAMRTGQLAGRHGSVLKRMQEEANRNTGEGSGEKKG